MVQSTSICSRAHKNLDQSSVIYLCSWRMPRKLEKCSFVCTYICPASLTKVSSISAFVSASSVIGPCFLSLSPMYCLMNDATSPEALARVTSRRLESGSRVVMFNSPRPQITIFTGVVRINIEKQSRTMLYSSGEHKSRPSTTRNERSNIWISGSRRCFRSCV